MTKVVKEKQPLKLRLYDWDFRGAARRKIELHLISVEGDGDEREDRVISVEVSTLKEFAKKQGFTSDTSVNMYRHTQWSVLDQYVNTYLL